MLPCSTVVRGASQVAPVVKNLHVIVEVRDVGSIPGLVRSPGGGHSNPHQFSSLENSMDRSLAGQSIRSKRVRHD